MNLPTELLVKILSYLPICDKITTQHVSGRFKDVSATPSLWREFLWSEYEPRKMCIVTNILKAHGKHVRRIFFPAHVTPAKILEMACYCANVTHLRLPKNTQLSLDHLEEIADTITQLQQLDVFTSDIKCVQPAQFDHKEVIIRFLEVTATRVKNLVLRIDQSINQSINHQSFDQLRFCDPVSVLRILEKSCNEGQPLPSTISLLINLDYLNISSSILEFWLPSSYTLALFEIYLYDIDIVTMDLHPSIPLRKFQFGPAATPPLIKLSDHGILGLEYDIVYLSDYDHYGEVRHSTTPKYQDLYAVKEQHLHCITNLYSVSNVDFSHNISANNIYPGHLEQLAIACPNLQRLDLMNVERCLQSLQGLHAIVDLCQNL